MAGDDFTYGNAQHVFYNLDKLVRHLNQHHSDEVHVKYSTVNEYLDAVITKKEMFEVSKKDPYDRDFMPLVSYVGNQVIWTGFYSTRGAFKYKVRQLS